jgi:hypothetical protein
MKRIILTGILAMGLQGIACAQGPVPDPWVHKRNNYVVVPAPGGGATGLGYDAKRWSYWQTNSDARGNLYGYDAQGNYWTYNRQTNSYFYYGTEPRWDARCYNNIADFC